MVALVRDQLGRILGARLHPNRLEILLRRFERVGQRLRVPLIGPMDRCRNDRARIQIYRMLRFVAKPGAAVLHLGDPRIGIALALPILVGKLLSLTLLVHPDQIVSRRRLDAALLGKPPQHLPVALATVAAHDRTKRSIRLHRRRIHADPVTLDQAMLGKLCQDPGEYRLMGFQRQARTGLRKPGMIRHSLPARKQQKLPKAQAVGTAPLDPALAVQAFEVTDQKHPKVPARRQGLSTALRERIVGSAQILDKPIKIRCPKHRLKLVIKRMARRTRQLIPAQ